MSPAPIQQAQQIQQQAPRSGIIREYKDKMEEIKKLQSSNTSLDGSSNDNDLLDIDDSNDHNSKNNSHSTLSSQQRLQLSTTTITAPTIKQEIVEDIIKGNDDSFSKQITDSHTSSIVGSKHNSSKSSPNITAELHSVDIEENKSNSNGFSTTLPVEKQEIAEDDHENTTELSDSIFGDYNEISFRDLYDSNIHDICLDDIPLLDDALCQLKDRVGSILVYLGKVEIAKTNSTEKAKEFVKMIFDNIESVKTEKEIEELNKKYVPRFNIEHNDGMNLYDLYRMYHCDIPLLKAKCIIPYYPDDESFEKKLLYRVLPEAMKKGVIDSLERYFYGIFELSAQARIGKIRESIKQKQELSRLDKILNDPGLSGDQLLEI